MTTNGAMPGKSGLSHPTQEHVAPSQRQAKWRLVLDTNAVLDWLHFRDVHFERIGRGIEAGAVSVRTSPSCLEELRRVLSYPQFGLDGPSQSGILTRFRMQALLCDEPSEADGATLPRCRDADDQKFLVLARATQAHYLLTRDKALLKLGKRAQACGFSVLTPKDFDARMQAETR